MTRGPLPFVQRGPWLDIVGTEPWVDIVGTEPWVDIVGTEPWVDIVGTEPWVDIVGADADVTRRRAWYKTRGLIQSAIREVTASDRRGWEVPWNVTAYVWALNPDGTTSINPSWSPDAAQASFRRYRVHAATGGDRALRQDERALAEPVRWTKNPDPAYEDVIAQQVARYASPRTAGVGGGRGHDRRRGTRRAPSAGQDRGGRVASARDRHPA